ncbi:MAG TPA: SDR family oxidoreductase [Polyangia bacterium]|jgi:thioester reductase-like protein
MASKVFITGFPGFIAKRLVDRLLRKDPAASFTFLIEERLRSVAESAVAELAAKHAGLAPRVRLVAGDISRPLLGIARDVYDGLVMDVTHVFHLAAIYDLAVPLQIAYRVNVIGTANVLDFCEDCEHLRRLDYVSTCYVSGDRTGLILERELDEGQIFKNNYESTKCWAEMEVRRRMDHLPVCIVRPAVVVGDSKTGETDKYDGPYFIISKLLHLPTWVPLVNIGQSNANLNLVPVDFVVDAMAELWVNDEALGQTIHVADPYPHTGREVLGGILETMGFRKPVLDAPPALLEASLQLKPLQRLLKIPKEVIAYSNHEVYYDTTNQRRLLERTGVKCPDLLSLLPTMVDYVRAHPKKRFLDQRDARR